MSFYDDFMKEMREIAKPNRAVKKKHKQLPSKDEEKYIPFSLCSSTLALVVVHIMHA